MILIVGPLLGITWKESYDSQVALPFEKFQISNSSKILD
jgi:hypothetical protein